MQTLNGINIFNPEIFSFGAAASSMPVEKEINPVQVQPQRMSQTCPADDLDFEDDDYYDNDFEDDDYYDNDFEDDDFEDEDAFEDEDDFEEEDMPKWY